MKKLLPLMLLLCACSTQVQVDGTSTAGTSQSTETDEKFSYQIDLVKEWMNLLGDGNDEAAAAYLSEMSPDEIPQEFIDLAESKEYVVKYMTEVGDNVYLQADPLDGGMLWSVVLTETGDGWRIIHVDGISSDGVSVEIE